MSLMLRVWCQQLVVEDEAGKPSYALKDTKKVSFCCFGTSLNELVDIVYEISFFFERNLNIFQFAT